MLLKNIYYLCIFMHEFNICIVLTVCSSFSDLIVDLWRRRKNTHMQMHCIYIQSIFDREITVYFLASVPWWASISQDNIPAFSFFLPWSFPEVVSCWTLCWGCSRKKKILVLMNLFCKSTVKTALKPKCNELRDWVQVQMFC